ncbi:MAG: 50S ribosomal protein L9 [Acidobacteriota bacterium]
MLKEDIENLGKKGDVLEVKAGYGRNYLIPKKLAIEITDSNMALIESEKKKIQKRIEMEKINAIGLAEKLNNINLKIYKKGGERDMIFGSVTVSDIKNSLEEQGIEIDRKKIILLEPIKRIGIYSIPIKILPEIKAEIKLEVLREE